MIYLVCAVYTVLPLKLSLKPERVLWVSVETNWLLCLLYRARRGFGSRTHNTDRNAATNELIRMQDSSSRQAQTENWQKPKLHFPLRDQRAHGEVAQSLTQALISWGHDWICGIRVTHSWPWSKPALGQPWRIQTRARTTVSGILLRLTAHWTYERWCFLAASNKADSGPLDGIYVRMFADRPIEHDKAWSRVELLAVMAD